MSTTYLGMILGYKRGANEQYPRQVLVSVDIDRKALHSLIGARVVARDRHNNVYIGKVVKILGSRSPKLVVTFRKNVPGQLISKQVLIEKPISK